MLFAWIPGSALAGPGETGHPKAIPKFEKWDGIKKEEKGKGAADGVANSLVYDLEGKAFPLHEIWSVKPVLLVHSSLSCPVITG